MELSELQHTVTSLWDNAVSARTLSTYQTGLRSFQTFLLMNNLTQHNDPLPKFYTYDIPLSSCIYVEYALPI